MEDHSTYFAPQLYIKSGILNIDFYSKAFGGVELRRWSNDDQSIHVAELSINGAIFHLHESTPESNLKSPEELNASTAVIGLFTSDIDLMMKNAEMAGAKIISPAKDYEYGLRQGIISDPFGHRWLIQRKISF